MRKILAVLAVLTFLVVPAYADSFGARLYDAVTNPVAVGGGKYLVTDPGPGISRAAFFLTANVPLFRVTDWLDIGGAGVSLNSVIPGLESTAGAGISVPFVTVFIKSSQVVAQAGWGWDLMQTPASGGPYAGIGWSFNSAEKVKAKRLEREAKAAKKAANLMGPPDPRI